MPKIVDRLARQLAAKGNKNSYGMAVGILRKYGELDAHGNLTPKGKARQALGAAGRAKSRASVKSGKPMSSYSYDKKTNTAKLKRGK